MKCPREILECNSGVSLPGEDGLLIQSQVVNPASDVRDVDFSEYEWMGEELEEFDKQCMDEFLEEDFIEACFEDMLDEEEEVNCILENLTPEDRISLVDVLERLSLSEGEESLIPQIFLVDNDEDRQDVYTEEDSEDR